MKSTPRRFPWVIGTGFVMVVLVLGLAFMFARVQARMPDQQPLPVFGQVPDFSLTNQNGGTVSMNDLKGHVWIADIIFTRCAGPCIRMTRQMKELEDALSKDESTRLISLTTDPGYDTPAILKTYAEKNGADFSRWSFLTGAIKQVNHLAVDGLKLSAVEKTADERVTPDDLWVHSTIFVLVDKHGQLRAICQTGGDDVSWPSEKQKLLAEVKQLERES